MNAKLAQRYHNDGMAVTPRPQLVVKLYERLLTDLEQASQAASDRQVEAAHVALLHAQEIVYELSLALDVDSWDGGPGLQAIYEHLTSRLIDANLNKSSLIIAECIDVVAPLVDAWQQALVISQVDRATASGDTQRGTVSA